MIPGELDNDPECRRLESQTADGGELEFYPAKKNGELIGTAVKTYTNNGFGGKIWLMVGFNPDGSVANYSVLEHKETPGLGSKMDVWFTSNGKGNITGKTPGYPRVESIERRWRRRCDHSSNHLVTGISGRCKPGSSRFGRQCGCSFRSNTTNKIIYDFRFTMNLKS